MDNNGERFSKTWCVLPWIHAATLTDGSVRLCCVSECNSKINLNQHKLDDYWNGNYIKNVRTDMLNGRSVSACQRCYDEEKSGYRSHRIVENKAWQEKIGASKIDSIVSKTNKDGHLNSDLMAIDLRLGNTCNLQCIMCQPRESSKWAGSSQKLISQLKISDLKFEWINKSRIDVKQYEWYKNPLFWSNMTRILPNLREIIFGGGEPMLIREHLDFIKFCAESGESNHIHIRYHTNLMSFPKELIPYWEKFERVEFFVSVDAIDEAAHYIRYPSVWKTIEDNLQLIDNMAENTWLRFLCSAQATNMLEIPKLVRWVRDKKFKKQNCFNGIQAFVHPGIVHWPHYLNPKVLPTDIKLKVVEEFKQLRMEFPNDPFDKFEGVLNFMKSEDWNKKFSTFIEYLEGLDKMRGTDYKTTFPYFNS